MQDLSANRRTGRSTDSVPGPDDVPRPARHVLPDPHGCRRVPPADPGPYVITLDPPRLGRPLGRHGGDVGGSSRRRGAMFVPMDTTAQGFMLAESRNTPMHVGGLQLFEPPEGAGPEWGRKHVRGVAPGAPPSRRSTSSGHAVGADTAGTWCWTEDDEFDLEYHVRHSALPAPGRVRELLELLGRLHGTRLALERPLWEMHYIEGLEDGRFAIYSKLHHALVDGVAAMRLLQATLSTDPDDRTPCPPGRRRTSPRQRWSATAPRSVNGCSTSRSVPSARAGRSAPRRPGCRRAAEDPQPRGCATRPRPSPSTPADDPEPRHHRRAALRGPALADRPDQAVGKASGPRSTTSCSRCAAARCASTSSSSTRCRASRWSRWCRSASARRRGTTDARGQRGRHDHGEARHDEPDAGRPPGAIHRVGDAAARRRSPRCRRRRSWR